MGVNHKPDLQITQQELDSLSVRETTNLIVSAIYVRDIFPLHFLYKKLCSGNWELLLPRISKISSHSVNNMAANS